jgi:hypothetical protein
MMPKLKVSDISNLLRTEAAEHLSINLNKYIVLVEEAEGQVASQH